MYSPTALGRFTCSFQTNYKSVFMSESLNHPFNQFIQKHIEYKWLNIRMSH